jgi:hypothetical protein
MFNKKECQLSPVHAFRIEMKSHSNSIGQMKSAFLQVKEEINNLQVKTIDTVNEILNKRNKVRNSINVPFHVYWNSAKLKYTSSHCFAYNILRNTRKTKGREYEINENYGLVIHVYLIDKNNIKSLQQFDNHFLISLTDNAIIETATINKPNNFLFEIKKENESFFVRTKAEASYLEGRGHSATAIKFIEVNGRFFEVLNEIDSNKIKFVDIHSDKVKGYKLQKNAKLDGRPFFEVTMEGFSSKTYFTVDFKNVGSGFYKVYGEIEGYVLVESISTILLGKQTLIFFIHKDEKDKIKLIQKSMTLID